MRGNETLVLALPRGRILEEVTPLLKRTGIVIEAAFDDPSSRQLRFKTNDPGLDVIRVRSFDVATFVAFGAAQLGVAGNDVLMEFNYPEIYVPLDLDIGKCRLCGRRAQRGRGSGRSPRCRPCPHRDEVSRDDAAALCGSVACRKPSASPSTARWNWRRAWASHAPDPSISSPPATLRANGRSRSSTLTDITPRASSLNRTSLKTLRRRVNRALDRALPRERIDAA